MTVSSTTRKTALNVGNGVTTSYAFTFKVQSTADIMVMRLEDGVETEVPTADYTVTLNSNQNTNPGGSVLFDTAPTSAQSFIITTDADPTQEQNIQNQASFNPSIVMEALDKLTIQVQQLARDRNLSLRFPLTGAGDGVLPGVDDRAGKYLTFDGSGDVAASDGSTPGTVAVSTYMATLLGAASQLAFAQSAGYQLRFYPEKYGAVADGGTAKTDNATALQAALDAAAAFPGAVVWVGDGKDYGFGTRLNLSDYNGFDGDGTGSLRMLNSTGKFTNTDGGGATRYGTNALGVYATGKTKPFLRNVKMFIDTPTQGQFVRPVYFTGCVDPEITDNDFTGFTEVEIVAFSACTRPKILRNYIHDCLYNYTPIRRQLTGIGVDNDGAASTDVLIAWNTIKSLTCSAAVIAAWGYESDAINIIRQGTTGLIAFNTLESCGEGVDSFGEVSILHNVVRSMYNFGLKKIHGGGPAFIAYNRIYDSGLAHIVLAGTNAYTEDTADLVVEHNYCKGLDGAGVWSASDSAGILFQANGGTTYLARRAIVRFNHIDVSGGGRYGVLGVAGSATGAEVYDNRVIGASVVPYNLDGTAGSLTRRAYQFRGLTLSNNATDATNDIDIAPGSVTDSSGAEVLHLGATITKRLDATWAVGTNQGGLDTGAIANATYHVWLIMRSDTRVTDVLFSTQETSPTMPTGYDYKAYLGAIIRSAGTILAFTQNLDEFLLKVPPMMVNTADPGTAAVLGSMQTPLNVKVDAIITVSLKDTTVGADTYMLVTSVDQTDTAPGIGTFSLAILNTSGTIEQVAYKDVVRTDTSRQVRYRLSASTADHTVYIITHGWYDRRGRRA